MERLIIVILLSNSKTNNTEVRTMFMTIEERIKLEATLRQEEIKQEKRNARKTALYAIGIVTYITLGLLPDYATRKHNELRRVMPQARILDSIYYARSDSLGKAYNLQIDSLKKLYERVQKRNLDKRLK